MKQMNSSSKTTGLQPIAIPVSYGDERREVHPLNLLLRLDPRSVLSRPPTHVGALAVAQTNKPRQYIQTETSHTCRSSRSKRGNVTEK